MPSTISIFRACGSLGSPGIRMMDPDMATTKPEPALRIRRSIGSVKPFGAPSAFGSAVSDNDHLGSVIDDYISYF